MIHPTSIMAHHIYDQHLSVPPPSPLRDHAGSIPSRTLPPPLHSYEIMLDPSLASSKTLTLNNFTSKTIFMKNQSRLMNCHRRLHHHHKRLNHSYSSKPSQWTALSWLYSSDFSSWSQLDAGLLPAFYVPRSHSPLSEMEGGSNYTRKNFTSCSKSANKPSTSCVRTACLKLSTSLEQRVNSCNNFVDIIRLVARLFRQVRYIHDITILLQPCVVNLVRFLLYHDCTRLVRTNL